MLNAKLSNHLNSKEKHHFVPFEILNVICRLAQHEYDSPHDLYDVPLTAAQRYSKKHLQPNDQPTESEPWTANTYTP